MNEHTFSSKIIRKCRDKGIELAWKINDNFAGGVPDAWFLGKGTTLWIEFKFLQELPKKGDTVLKPNLSKQQALWLSKLYNAEQPCAVVIGLPKEAIIIVDPMIWERGMLTKQARKNLITHDNLVEWILTACPVAPPV